MFELEAVQLYDLNKVVIGHDFTDPGTQTFYSVLWYIYCANIHIWNVTDLKGGEGQSMWNVSGVQLSRK